MSTMSTASIFTQGIKKLLIVEMYSNWICSVNYNTYKFGLSTAAELLVGPVQSIPALTESLEYG